MKRRRTESGIALLLVSGLVALFALLALAMAQAGHLGDAARAARLSRAESALAAESGLHYAAARLAADPLTTRDRAIPRSPANACDDWTRRGSEDAGLRPRRLANPSYNRGDHWQDLSGGTAGAYDPGTDDFVPARDDRNGNGRFDGASGRLRGDLRFALKISSTADLINVNAGDTGSPADDADSDGLPNEKDAYNEDDNENGLPDWQDDRSLKNIALVNLLNNLGAILDVSTAARHPDVTYAPEPCWGVDDDMFVGNYGNNLHKNWFINTSISGVYRSSRLGNQVVRGRPRGGYRSMTDLKSVLSPTDYAKTSPFLSTDGMTTSIPLLLDYTVANFRAAGDADSVRLARIDLNGATREVIEAALMYFSSGGWSGVDRDGDGLTDVNGQETVFTRLWPEEARALAEKIVSAREDAPFRSWRQLGQWLANLPSGVFKEDDPFTSQLGTGADRRKWKEALVLSMSANLFIPDLYAPSLDSLDLGGGYGIPRRVSSLSSLAAAVLVPHPFFPLNGSPNGLTNEYEDAFASRATAVFSLNEKGGIFDVLAEGWSSPDAAARLLRGQVVNERSFHLTGQQDFEQLPRIEWNGLTRWRWDYPGGEVFHDGAIDPYLRSSAKRYRIQSHPRFPIHSFRPEDAWREQYRYMTGVGDLRLSALQVLDFPANDPNNPLRRYDGVFALPFNEDADGSDSWRRNAGDPLDRHAVTPSLSMADAVLGGVGGSFSPLGICLLPPPTPGEACLTSRWTGPGFLPPDPFPLPRADWPNPPPDPQLAQDGEIERGGISFWAPTNPLDIFPWEESNDTYPWASVSLGYRARVSGGAGGDQIVERPYCEVAYKREGGKEKLVWSSDGGASGTLELASIPGLPSRPWRHVAVVFDNPDGLADLTATMQIYVDGVLTVPTAPISMTRPWGYAALNPQPGERPTAQMVLKVKATAVDDVCLYRDDLRQIDPNLGIPKVQVLAEEGRYHQSGSYTTPVYTFSPELYPEGAILRGIEWDCHIPAALPSGAWIGVSVTGVQDSGQEWSRATVYTRAEYAGGAPQSFRFPIPTPPCRKFYFTIDIDSGVGAQFFPFESPILDSVSVVYARPAVRLTHFAEE